MTRMAVSLVVVVPLLFGMNGSEPAIVHPDIADCPFPVDASLVEGTLLGWLQVEVGRQMAHTRTYSDPEGDSVKVEIIKGPEGATLINKPRIHSYTILWTPTHPTTTAIVVRATDNPVTGSPASSVGTILIQAVPASQRRGASPCGGQPR
jgi:hypothetical protein